jgi:transcriptional regulator with XRE-family HTH domain
MKLTLRAARINKGLNVKEVAKALSVTTQTIYNWEQGVTEPRMEHLKQLAQIYNMGLEDFK